MENKNIKDRLDDTKDRLDEFDFKKEKSIRYYIEQGTDYVLPPSYANAQKDSILLEKIVEDDEKEHEECNNHESDSEQNERTII